MFLAYEVVCNITSSESETLPGEIPWRYLQTAASQPIHKTGTIYSYIIDHITPQTKF